MTCGIHGGFRITAAKAGCDLPFQSRGADNPLEGLTAVEGVPNPASVRGKRAGHASVETIRIRRIDPQARLETNPANAADDRMPEGRRGAPRCRRRETDHSQQHANGRKSKSYEDALIKETGLRRGIFFHGDFPLLAAVEIVADNSNTSARPDAFFSDHSKSAAENFGPSMFLRHLSILARASPVCLQSNGTRLHSQADPLLAARLRHFNRALKGARC